MQPEMSKMYWLEADGTLPTSVYSGRNKWLLLG